MAVNDGVRVSEAISHLLSLGLGPVVGESLGSSDFDINILGGWCKLIEGSINSLGSFDGLHLWDVVSVVVGDLLVDSSCAWDGDLVWFSSGDVGRNTSDDWEWFLSGDFVWLRLEGNDWSLYGSLVLLVFENDLLSLLADGVRNLVIDNAGDLSLDLVGFSSHNLVWDLLGDFTSNLSGDFVWLALNDHLWDFLGAFVGFLDSDGVWLSSGLDVWNLSVDSELFLLEDSSGDFLGLLVLLSSHDSCAALVLLGDWAELGSLFVSLVGVDADIVPVILDDTITFSVVMVVLVVVVDWDTFVSSLWLIDALFFWDLSGLGGNNFFIDLFWDSSGLGDSLSSVFGLVDNSFLGVFNISVLDDLDDINYSLWNISVSDVNDSVKDSLVHFSKSGFSNISVSGLRDGFVNLSWDRSEELDFFSRDDSLWRLSDLGDHFGLVSHDWDVSELGLSDGSVPGILNVSGFSSGDIGVSSLNDIVVDDDLIVSDVSEGISVVDDWELSVWNILGVGNAGESIRWDSNCLSASDFSGILEWDLDLDFDISVSLVSVFCRKEYGLMVLKFSSLSSSDKGSSENFHAEDLECLRKDYC